MNIIEALTDPNTLGASFPKIASWRSWVACLRAAFGLHLNARDEEIYRRHTERTTAPKKAVRELWVIVGRRGGKSRITAALGVFLAAFKDYSKHLSIGERATVAIIAGDRAQARTIFRYVHGMFHASKLLRRMIEREGSDFIDLNNSVTIEVHTCSFRSTRGYTLAAVLADETAFWRDESSTTPDTEVLNALRPGLTTIPGAMLVAISTPYARRGALFETHRDYFGHEHQSILVWQGSSKEMNPTLSDEVIAEAYKRDPVAAEAEYGAQFRGDVSAFLDDQWIDSAIRGGVHEIPPHPGSHYVGFTDPSGGASDAFTLAIAHAEGKRLILDLCRGRRPPFDPHHVAADYAQILRRYGLRSVTGDRYSAEWVASAFSDNGIHYEVSELTKSEIYLEAQPLFATGSVELLDNRQLIYELRQLERRTARGGKDSIDHPPRTHDDLANSTCGALVNAIGQGPLDLSNAYVSTHGELRDARDTHLADLGYAGSLDDTGPFNWR